MLRRRLPTRQNESLSFFKAPFFSEQVNCVHSKWSHVEWHHAHVNAVIPPPNRDPLGGPYSAPSQGGGPYLGGGPIQGVAKGGMWGARPPFIRSEKQICLVFFKKPKKN